MENHSLRIGDGLVIAHCPQKAIWYEALVDYARSFNILTEDNFEFYIRHFEDKHDSTQKNYVSVQSNGFDGSLIISRSVSIEQKISKVLETSRFFKFLIILIRKYLPI